MSDYAIIQLFGILRDILGPLLGGGLVLFTAYKFWKVWVENRGRKLADRRNDELLKRIDLLEQRLAGPQLEKRIRDLEDIVVTREIDQR